MRPLGDDVGARLLPQRDAARVIPVRVGQDNRLDRAAVRRGQRAFVRRRGRRDARVDDDVPIARHDHEGVALRHADCGPSHHAGRAIDAVTEILHLGRLRRGRGGGCQRAGRRKQDEPVPHQKSSLPMRSCMKARCGDLSADSQ